MKWVCSVFFAGESKVVQIPATPCSPPPSSSSSSSSSVTTQPARRTDLFPSVLTEASPATPAGRPPTPSPEPELQPPAPSLSKEEGDEAHEVSETKHRTPKKDLLEIDRFTICGNRIDWPVTAVEVARNHSGQTKSKRPPDWTLPVNSRRKLTVKVGDNTVKLWTWAHSVRWSHGPALVDAQSQEVWQEKLQLPDKQQEWKKCECDYWAVGWSAICLCERMLDRMIQYSELEFRCVFVCESVSVTAHLHFLYEQRWDQKKRNFTLQWENRVSDVEGNTRIVSFAQEHECWSWFLNY